MSSSREAHQDKHWPLALQPLGGFLQERGGRGPHRNQGKALGLIQSRHTDPTRHLRRLEHEVILDLAGIAWMFQEDPKLTFLPCNEWAYKMTQSGGAEPAHNSRLSLTESRPVLPLHTPLQPDRLSLPRFKLWKHICDWRSWSYSLCKMVTVSAKPSRIIKQGTQKLIPPFPSETA